MNEFWAALLGAGVGALASIAGSIVVNRFELTRRTRITLHRELLPAIARASQGPLPSTVGGELIEKLALEVTLAGRGDRRRAEKVIRSWRWKVYLLEQSPPPPSGTDEAFRNEWTKRNVAHVQAVMEIQKYLRRKLGGRSASGD